MTESPPRATARLWCAVLIIVFAAVGALRAARSRTVGGDFLRYHRAGRLVVTGRAERIYDREWLERAQVYAQERAEELARSDGRSDDFREREFKYAPAFAVLMAPLGALHPRTGWVLWGAWNGAMIGLTFAAAWGCASRGASWLWMLPPSLALLHAVNDNSNLGQLNPTAIAAATVSVHLLDRGREATAGAIAAVGTVVKFLPGLLVIWFAATRRWTAAAVLVAATALLGLALPAAVLGPSRSVDLLDAWWQARHRVYTGLPGGDLPGHSLKSFVYRVFGDVPYRSGSGAGAIEWNIGVAAFDPALLRATVVVLAGVLLVIVLMAGRRASRDDARASGPLAASLFVSWMILASPEARSPHFLYLALPLSALSYGLAASWRERRPSRTAATLFTIVGAILLNTSSESMFGRDLANRLASVCAMGWGTACVMAATGLLLRDRRRSAAD